MTRRTVIRATGVAAPAPTLQNAYHRIILISPVGVGSLRQRIMTVLQSFLKVDFRVELYALEDTIVPAKMIRTPAPIYVHQNSIAQILQAGKSVKMDIVQWRVALQGNAEVSKVAMEKDSDDSP